MIRESTGWLAVAVGQVLICLAVTSCPAHAEDLWVSVTTFSYHRDNLEVDQRANSTTGNPISSTGGARHFETNFNERNWGAGIEYGIGEGWRAVAGTYRNSVFRRSNYAGFHWVAWYVGSWRLGGIGGFVSGYPGYSYGWGPMLAPVLSYERERFGANLIAFPKIGEISTAVALQIKARF